ncbi:MAG: T9SS type A sorting domain-containing protein [Bacteroidales bacterium]|nr:T9SS type A sorting domain-containing protein [Bacteroidales bacterium]
MNIGKRILLLTLAVFNFILLNAQGTVPTNSVWRDQVTTTAPISDTNSNIDNSQYEIPTLTPEIVKKNAGTTKIAGNLEATQASGRSRYKFSGGNGTDEANAFLISTPQDLIDLSNAVNSSAQYRLQGNNTNRNYSEAYYKMTNDINFGERVAGPFVICQETLNGTFTGRIHTAQYILKAEGPDGGPYTCPGAVDDQNNATITVANKTSTTTKTRNEGAFNVYSYTFTYKYYDAETLPLSALMAPIGRFVAYNNGENTYNNLVIPFKGKFDGAGYTISNMEIVASSDAAGLFGYLNNTAANPAIVQNLNMNNCNISNMGNTNAGAICGVLGHAMIINCSVTNSTVCGSNAGGIAGKPSTGNSFLWWGSNGKSDGSVNDSYSGNNEIIGVNVGGVIGRTPDGTDSLVNNSVSNNGLHGDNVGVITPGVDDDGGGDGYYGNGNYDLSDANGLSFTDYVKTILEGKIPDFCYINSGRYFDPSVEKDRKTLESLSRQLNGTDPVTLNLVLPNITKLEDLSSALNSGEKDRICEKMYEQHIMLGRVSTPCALWAAYVFENNQNVYRRNGDGDFVHSTGAFNIANEYYYHITGDQDVYYKYYLEAVGGGGIKVLFTDKKYGEAITSADTFAYLYPGWNCYPDDLKNTYKNDITPENLTNITGLGDLSRYYKLTAAGTKANPIVVEQEVGANVSGGLYDKGGQLEGKIVQLKRTLPLQQWSLIGLAKIEEMGDGWNGKPMDQKLNFLSNTKENNDFAAVEYDYETNNWSEDYLKFDDDLKYGKGIFIWPYNTAHPLAQDGLWDFTTTTMNMPVLYQTGVVKAYTDSTALNAAIATYISGLSNTGDPNTSGDEAPISRWFALANPFLAEIDPEVLISHLNGPSTIPGRVGNLQGECLYKYKVGALGNAQWARVITVPRAFAGDGFLAGIAIEDGTQLQGTISTQDLYGYDYVPLVSSPIETSKKKSSVSALRRKTQSLSNSMMTFLCYDMENVGLCKNMTAKYSPDSRNHFDRSDAYALLASSEKYCVEPFFVVNGVNIWHNGFNRLPYDAPIGFNANKNCEVMFSVVGVSDSLDVYLMNARTDEVLGKLSIDTVINGSDSSISRDIVTLNLEQGYNLGKYKIRFCRKGSNVGITDVVQMPEADVTIWNNNREVTINGDNLKYVEVCNTLGQKVYTRELAGDTYKFDLKAISGAYIIRVKTDEGIKTQKIVIK